MKTYEGKRTIDGLVVTVDGKPLDERYDVKQFTKYGFEWTYEGPSPQQLALAILADHIGDPDRALRLSKPFMERIIANLDNDWSLDGAQVEAAIQEVEQTSLPRNDSNNRQPGEHSEEETTTYST